MTCRHETLIKSPKITFQILVFLKHPEFQLSNDRYIMCYISIAGTLDKGGLKIDFTVESESKIFNVMSSLSAFNLATLLGGSDNNYKSQINS